MTRGPETSPPPPAFLAPLGRVPAPWVLGLAIALLLLAAPYRGIRHDGLLYAAQALTHVDPTWFSRDFFFRDGSQDQFTLFTRVLGAVYGAFDGGAFGIGGPTLVLLLLGLVLSLAAVWLLTAGWPAWQRALAVLAYAGLSHHFGPGQTFGLLEPFLTARTFAEPLSLLAIAAVLRGRPGLAGLALLLALACHPLVALPALVAIWFDRVAGDRRWLGAALVLVPALGLGLAGVQPFARVFQVFDPDWLAAVLATNEAIFVGRWAPGDWVMLLGDAAFLAIALRGRAGPLARFSRAAIGAALASVLVSWVGADLLHDVLITQLQLWRAAWVLQVVFVVWLPVLCVELWQRGGTGRLAAWAVFFVAPAVSDSFPTAWALLLWAIGLVVLDARGVALTSSVRRLVFLATLAIGLVTTGQKLWGLLIQVRMSLQGTALTHLASLPFTVAILTVPLCVLLLRGCAGAGRVGPACRAGVAALLVVAAWQFDQRPAFARTLETAQPASHPFEALIPPGAQVQWEDLDVAPPWLLLRRPSFSSQSQISGLVFNRVTALAARERLPFMAAVAQRQEQCRVLQGMMPGDYRFENCRTPEDLFFVACELGPEHADFAVTREVYSRPALAAWRYVPDDGGEPVTYYLHDCRSPHA